MLLDDPLQDLRRAAPVPDPFRIDDRYRSLLADAQAVRLGAVDAALAREPTFEWRRGGEALTWLLGTRRVFRDLDNRVAVAEILAADAADHAAWRAARRPALLYPPEDDG